MFTFKRLRRRVLISHSPERLRVRIAADNERLAATGSLVWVTAFAALFFWSFAVPVLRRNLSGIEWFLMLIPVAIVGAYLLVLRATIWQAFGVDDIAVEHGMLHWSAKAWWFRQELEIPVNEISQVKAVTAWFSKGNHVEMTVGARRYLIGDHLLQYETTELANALKHAVGARS